MRASFRLLVSIQNPPAKASGALTSSPLAVQRINRGCLLSCIAVYLPRGCGTSVWASRTVNSPKSPSPSSSSCCANLTVSLSLLLPLQDVTKGSLSCPLQQAWETPSKPRKQSTYLIFVTCLCHLLLHFLVASSPCGARPSTIFYCHYLLATGTLRP